MNLKSLIFSFLLASAVIPTAQAYNSNTNQRLTVEALENLSKGMTQQAVNSTIGKPVMRTSGSKDTWIYKAVANTSHGVDICNVKIEFDNLGLLQRAYWDESNCDNSIVSKIAPANQAQTPTYRPEQGDLVFDGMMSPKRPRILPVLDYDYPKIEEPPLAEFTVASDILFDFDKSDIKPTAHAELIRMFEQVRSMSDDFKIIIIGHTDRIGKPSYNGPLSERRAMAVGLFYMNQFGVPSDNIYVEGVGSREPVTQCGNLPRKELIQCLQPDRRVLIIFRRNFEGIIPQ